MCVSTPYGGMNIFPTCNLSPSNRNRHRLNNHSSVAGAAFLVGSTDATPPLATHSGAPHAHR